MYYLIFMFYFLNLLCYYYLNNKNVIFIKLNELKNQYLFCYQYIKLENYIKYFIFN